MEMGGMNMTAPPPAATGAAGHHSHRPMMMMHMTFFWGTEGQILFSGWPGASTGMYVVALALTFALSLLVEFLSRHRLLARRHGEGGGSLAGGLLQTLVHAIRVGLAYLIMLALMSFNGGVFVAAIAGHAVGFLFFGSRAFNKPEEQPPYVKRSDLPASMNC